MTCRDHELSLLDRARGVLAPEAAPALDDHLRHCQACAARLGREIALTADLRALAASTARLEPSESLEQALLQQLSRLRAGAGEAAETPDAAAARRPLTPQHWLAAAAAIVVMAGAAAAWRLALRPPAEQADRHGPSALAATRSFAPTAVAARLVPPPGDVVASTAVVRARPPVGRQPSRASASGRTPRAGQAVEFVAWPGAAALPPLESGEVVRTELPASVLPLLGLRQAAPARARVAADVIVGQDGMARAVRIVFER